MKKLGIIVCFFFLGFFQVSALYEQEEFKNAAYFLGQTGIIENRGSDIEGYGLYDTVSRREMLKVMMNLSGKQIASNCTGKFKDLPASDWGCKYAEAAVQNGFITLSTNFRPNDAVTDIEVLKMVMQARGIPKMQDPYFNLAGEEGVVESWEDQYMNGAIITYLPTWDRYVSNNNYDSIKIPPINARRKDVFLTAARSLDEYILNIGYWKTYETEDFSIKYPYFWVLKESPQKNKDKTPVVANDLVVGYKYKELYKQDSYTPGYVIPPTITITQYESSADFDNRVLSINQGNLFSANVDSQVENIKSTTRPVITTFGLDGKVTTITGQYAGSPSPNHSYNSDEFYFEKGNKIYGIYIANDVTEIPIVEEFYKSFDIK